MSRWNSLPYDWTGRVAVFGIVAAVLGVWDSAHAQSGLGAVLGIAGTIIVLSLLVMHLLSIRGPREESA